MILLFLFPIYWVEYVMLGAGYKIDKFSFDASITWDDVRRRLRALWL